MSNGFNVVELQNSAQRRATANILELREISQDHSVEETEASSTSTLREPARAISKELDNIQTSDNNRDCVCCWCPSKSSKTGQVKVWNK